MLAHRVLQLDDPRAGDPVEGGGLFAGGAPHVVLGLGRLPPQDVLGFDEPRPRCLLEGGGFLDRGHAHLVVRRRRPLGDAPGLRRCRLLDPLAGRRHDLLDRLALRYSGIAELGGHRLLLVRGHLLLG
jgi:hypothetical protein